MRALRIYVEDIAGEWYSWIEGCPGAFGRGTTPEFAVMNAPRALSEYLAWLSAHDEPIAGEMAEMASVTLHLEEVERHYAAKGRNGQELNAFFPIHAAPLSGHDVERALRLLEHSRSDLMSAQQAIPPDEFHSAPFGGRSVSGILTHIAEGERTLVRRIGGTNSELDLRDPVLAVEMARRDFVRSILAMDPALRDRVLLDGEERWTLRKALDRALWHERFHAAQIADRSNPSAYLHSIVVGQGAPRNALSSIW